MTPHDGMLGQRLRRHAAMARAAIRTYGVRGAAHRRE